MGMDVFGVTRMSPCSVTGFNALGGSALCLQITDHSPAATTKI